MMLLVFRLLLRYIVGGGLVICILASVGHADKTRLENDKLIFSNGGGFQNEADVISVLNIGKSGTYVSKGVNVVGDYITIDNDTQDLSGTHTTKEISDNIPLDILSGSTVGSEYAAKFLGNGLNTFPTNMKFLIGDCTRKYLVMNAQKIGAIKVTKSSLGPKVHSDDILYIQKNKAPAYFGNITNTNGPFTPAMSVYGQLVINGVLMDIKRVGINTKDPSETLTIAGDLKVDGKLNASTGMFRPTQTYPTSYSLAANTVWTTVASNIVKVKYAAHGVFIAGNVAVANMDIAEARISIKHKELPTSTTFTDFTPDSGSEEVSSYVKFTGSSTQYLFSLYPTWTGDLPTYTDPTIEKEYLVEVQVKYADTSWSVNRTISFPPNNGGFPTVTLTSRVTHGAELTIIGLPSSTFQPPVNGSVSNATAYSQDTLFTFNPINGNFLTENLLGFKTDGFIIDSNTGLNMLYASGTKYKPFKASKITADNLYEQQLLKVFGGTRNEPIFKLASGDITLGFNSAFALNEVSHNIQSMTTSSGASPLWFTQTNIGDGALTMNPDVTGNVDSVGIGKAPESGVALSVEGNVSFTGQYVGGYGKIIHKTGVGYINYGSHSNVQWISFSDPVITNVTVDKPSSVFLMAKLRAQDYNSLSSYPVVFRFRIKVKENEVDYAAGPVSQCVMSPDCGRNTIFCTLTTAFSPGKTYSAGIEFYTQFGGLKEIYDPILLMTIVPVAN